MYKQVVPRDVRTETRKEMLCQLRAELALTDNDVLREHIERLVKVWGLRTPAPVKAKAA
jgi:hypothetical protein